jgi:tetratricopeptide (TPR) repeat protein
VLSIEGSVEVASPDTENWRPAKTNEVLQVGERIRTGKFSRATLRSSQSGELRIRGSSWLTIRAPRPGTNRPVLDLLRGFFYFFNRDRAAEVDIQNRLATAAVHGTEFHVAVFEDGRMELAVIDGEVQFSTAQGPIVLLSGEQGTAEAGRTPTKTAMLEAVNIIQWCLYYPGVLNLDELALNADEEHALNDSLAAYRSGDVLQALGSYPENRLPVSDAEKVYRAALLLVVGEVEPADALLKTLPAPSPLAQALRELIAAVKHQKWQGAARGVSATEHLAESYYLQSQSKLTEALGAARAAVTNSPNFGFAWARLAELEFSFGRTDRALSALENALRLSPRNAQALALKGFLLSAQNKIAEAIRQFDAAIALDGALANAWLGRGLCRIRQGQLEAGQADLLTAATLEPQRALLRSYLAKAFTDEGKDELARKELKLAQKLDVDDPTSWFYSALDNQQRNRINEAVRDLEKSQELNENRSVYRSRLLLDQDRAVRSANLAHIYRDAGMTDVSLREAARAVNYDYANYSAHLFLATSYDQMRDPNFINLRFETPANTEYLLANLLSPVGAGILSPQISQQEYSKLFERNRLGVVSTTEYLSRGAWTESGAQFGTFGNTSYSLEAFYRTDPGQRPNNDVEQRQLSLLLRQQLTAQDTVFLQAIDLDLNGGDLYQRYNESDLNAELRTHERQEPMFVLGYHHEWGPGMHTLLLAGRLSDVYTVVNSNQFTMVAGKELGLFSGIIPISVVQHYRSELEIYTTELQQIWQQAGHSTVVGARYQYGGFDTQNLQTHPSDLAGVLADPPASQLFDTLLRRVTAYGYHTWQVAEPLSLVAGVSYDHLTFPENHRIAPISASTDSRERVSPKAGVIWTPFGATTIRAAYSRSLGGASLEQSFQLEPSQVAGFNQLFRSIAPESVVGSTAGATFETFGASLEQKFATGTYVGVSGELLRSSMGRPFGVFISDLDVSDIAFTGSLRERLNYEERTLLVTLNQLIGQELSLGVRYRLSQATLDDEFPEVTDSTCILGQFRPSQHPEAVLHQLQLQADFNHHSGLFAQVQALWSLQSNQGYQAERMGDCPVSYPDLPGDDFWQLNAFVGYRFPHRRAELRVGWLNLTDQNYRLNPLTLYSELPHERTFVARLQFNF